MGSRATPQCLYPQQVLHITCCVVDQGFGKRANHPYIRSATHLRDKQSLACLLDASNTKLVNVWDNAGIIKTSLKPLDVPIILPAVTQCMLNLQIKCMLKLDSMAVV
mmetsp:Transcript_39110/g.93460  ORF Transcript_39110/g.93460 Transcript_39110/m.93460 type:complete len:107 (-) Transcript_39110:331-651(-)